MTTAEAGTRAQELREEILKHDRLYYAENESEVTDSEYDELMKELRGLESKHPGLAGPDSPTQRVGGEVSANFPEARHPEPMLSLGNAFNEEDLRAWHRRMSEFMGNTRFAMSAELKIDGLAVRVRYENGLLTLGATRGDGTAGENVTHTIKTVRALPMRLTEAGDFRVPRTLDARGEVYMPRSAFIRVNRERAERGEYQYANPRNAAAGGIRQLDPAEASKRRLNAWIYSTQQLEGGSNSHSANLEILRSMGLPVNPENRTVHSPEEIIEYYQRMLERRDDLDYEADGVVVKVGSISDQERIGATGHEPRWAIAWKFPSEKVTTKLISVSISHGRFGRLTPVANLKAVNVAGVTVQSASLHNETDMHRKDIRENEEVIIERAGDVIPQVIGPVNNDPGRDIPIFAMPESCPACGTPVTIVDGEIGHWCNNDDCPSRLPERLKHFVSKRAMNIEYMGEHWCEALIERGMVSDPADLYHLTRNQLLQLDRMGERSADRLLASIETSRRQPLDRILYSLGIYRLGREVSGLMARRCDSVDEAAAMEFHHLAQMDGIGPKIATSVVSGMRSPRVLAMIRTMRDGGVLMEKSQPDPEPEQEKENMQNEHFQGKTFVVTGKIHGMTRNEAQDAIHRQGGNTASSVTKSTTALIVGEGRESASSKLTKAQQLGVPIIEQEDFLSMLSA